MSLTQQPRAFGFLLSEGDGAISRDNAIIASGAGKLKAGAVLGLITASGKYVAHDPALSNGAQTAAAILCAPVDATSADAPAVVVARLAEVKVDALILNAATDTAPEKAAVYASLAAKNIIVR